MPTDTERLDWLQNYGTHAGIGLVEDDNGHWAVSSCGMQNVPLGDEPCDISTTYFIAACEWYNSVREAIDAAMAEVDEDGSGSEIVYPTRCEIVDADQASTAIGTLGNESLLPKTPEASRPHIGKRGTARETDNFGVVITLDDGSVLHGYECWWVPLDENDKVLERW